MPHPFVLDAIRDKIYGCIYGAALGDAIGLYTEFMSADYAEVRYPLPQPQPYQSPSAGSQSQSRSGSSGNAGVPRFILAPSFGLPTTPFHFDSHRSRFKEGMWTDDTDHAVLILLSFLRGWNVIKEKQRLAPNAHLEPSSSNILAAIDHHDFALRLADWVNYGLRDLGTPAIDVGISTRRITQSPGYSANPSQEAYKDWFTGGRENAANGSLMRTHALAILTAGNPSYESAIQTALENSRLTHADSRCGWACILQTTLVRSLIRGDLRYERQLANYVQHTLSKFQHTPNGQEAMSPFHLEVDHVLRFVSPDIRSLADLYLDAPDSRGYVLKTMGCALFLLRSAMRELEGLDPWKRAERRMSLFEELITRLAMAGGDADTNCAVAGALLGAYLGYSCLPTHWRAGLKNGEWLREKIELVYDALWGMAVV